MEYIVLHWRLDKVALVAVVLSTVVCYMVYKRLHYKCLPLAGRKTILETLVLIVCPPLEETRTVYFMLHCRLGKVALVAVVLSTVYIIGEPPSGWY